VILGAAAAMGLGVVVVGIHLTQLNAQLASKQQMIATLTSDNTQLQQQVAALQQTRQELEGRMHDLQTQVASATAELVRLHELEPRSRALEEEKTRLTQELAQVRQERDASQTRIGQLEDEKRVLEQNQSKLHNRLALVERDYQRLSAKLAETERNTPTFEVAQPVIGPSSASVPDASPVAGMSSGMGSASVELPPIVVRKDQAAAMSPSAASAHLLEVDMAHQFVVIDRGSDHGVRVGAAFDLVRNGVAIGQATASRVRPKITACDVTAVATGATPQVGDQAIQRSP